MTSDAPRTATAPDQFPDSPLSQIVQQPLILGLSLPVQSGGWSASLLPRTTDWTFGYNAALTKRGLILRAVGNYGLPDALRMTVGTEEANRLVVQALADFLDGRCD